MSFNSAEFFLFFPAVLALFFLLPQRYRALFLLIASYYFYLSWEPSYGLLLIGVTALTYFTGILIEEARTRQRKKLFLLASLLGNLGILFFFKYAEFFFSSIQPLINIFDISFSSPALQILLPIGISFYIFQAISYSIDIYRGTIRAERSLEHFALYISFFPQLVAGPIERAAHMLPQYHRNVSFNHERFVTGGRLMLWGFFKKIVIADNAAIIVDSIYRDPTSVNGVALATGTFFFAIQIYADFSGYTDIARGAARMLGYDLVINFKLPYFTRSISEFWSKWHISLTSWFQEYVFTPIYMALVRSERLSFVPRKHKHLTAFSIATLIGLTLLGLWHGAGTNFIIFGFSQALFIIFYHFVKKWWDKLPFIIANLFTFLMVLSGFIFFRAPNLDTALYIISTITNEFLMLIMNPALIATHFLEAGYSTGLDDTRLFTLIGLTIFLFTTEFLIESNKARDFFSAIPRLARWSTYYALIAIIVFFGNFGESAFVYFQF